MARKTRVVAAAAGMAGLLALVVAVTRDTGTRRRLGGPGALPTHALLPEHQRKWVHPAGQPVAHHHVRIDTHDRTTGYKPAAVWQIKIYGNAPTESAQVGPDRARVARRPAQGQDLRDAEHECHHLVGVCNRHLEHCTRWVC